MVIRRKCSLLENIKISMKREVLFYGQGRTISGLVKSDFGVLTQRVSSTQKSFTTNIHVALWPFVSFRYF